MANFVIEHRVMSRITALMAYQKVLMAHHRDYGHIKTMAHRGRDGTSFNGKCFTQYLICPNTMGNLRDINLLMDAKKYSTSLTVMKNCTALPQIGGRIVFEMQLFQNSSRGVFCNNAPMKSGSERKQVEFLQNLQIRRLKNSVRAQDSSLSRARERH